LKEKKKGFPRSKNSSKDKAYEGGKVNKKKKTQGGDTGIRHILGGVVQNTQKMLLKKKRSRNQKQPGDLGEGIINETQWGNRNAILYRQDSKRTLPRKEVRTGKGLPKARKKKSGVDK